MQKEGDGHCDYFLWVDKEVCDHCRRVMWRLREKEDELESEAKLREVKYEAEIAQHKNAIGIELAKLSLQLDFEKSKYSTLEKNFRMTLATGSYFFSYTSTSPPMYVQLNSLFILPP
jgi:hypothetical protein